MRWSVSIPQFDLTGADAPALRSYLTRAEQLGFEAGWTLEQAVGAAPLLAPLEVLAYAAACTDRLRLGVAVLVSTLHDPLQLAAAATTIDRLSGGRLELGVGAGGPSRRFAAFGVDRQTFLARFTEGLELMKAAWSDTPQVTFSGRFRHLEDVAIAPKPIQRPHPPLWFGGHAPAALARAVRHGDGFMGAGSATTAAFAEQVGVLRRELADQDRDPAGFRIGKRVYLSVDADAGRARDRVLAGIDRIYGGRLRDAAAVAVAGTPADVAGGLAAVLDAGAETIVLNPVGATVADDHEQMELLAAEVLPQLL
ncbi:LLM class flavin-dependent oxidoreductase [Mycolicibacillus parakoreensis]|uniref:LLM class flavin-dependent oxidoreductase n=1 Tax=Mycolicibacillus parakoreensis TaxID=1069221 RepID=A0ABY3U0E7_9MYCO|nr:LLM class flavin-dependent oxidoreductase [Mycolicibacillus parakoreensis]MCV7315401.1 LLM class flavin-dependent oxidoreductase [Mycolicibacillus parakoreensis]ULN52131.1 LLM class flavin-dependent oxidoreductase [Mycolicibacillus parakoreensis]